MKKYRYLIAGLVISIFTLLTILFWNNVYTYIKHPIAFVEYLKSVDTFKATVIFLVINYLQVILAFIPGGPFEIVAGLMYGQIFGIIICDLTMTIGSISIYLLVKKFGRKVIDLFIDIEEVDKLKFLKNNRNLSLILLMVFFIPGSPKDAISYGVGLTNLSLKNWIVINLIGRLPAICLTIVLSSSFAYKKYELAILVGILFVLLYLVGIKIYKKINSK